MNKNYYILFSLIVFILTSLSIAIYVFLSEPMHYRYYYEYVGLDGEKNISSACYTIEDGRNFCRNIKKTFPVIKYKKVKERKN